MQFHLNGFRPGDPHISEADARHQADGATDRLPAQVDVLIVGCGPTGLTLAAQLAAFPDITTRIVEQKSGRLLIGQADGVACRTMEMFEAFGFADRVMKEAYWVNEFAFWKPDEIRREALVRGSRIQDVEDGLSEFPHVVLNQARVHDFYLDVMHNSPTRLVPDYARRLLDLAIPSDAPDRPVTVRLERLDPGHEGEPETVSARFVVGCDGAHSAVRRALGLALHGDSANQAWGVMDVLAVTDFPDIRLKAAIQSAHDGSALIIPREGGYLFRIYIELDKLAENERVASLHITPERLVAAARRILHPYSLDVKEVAWWSVYEIGQRLCDRFDDFPEDSAAGVYPRVFIAGDACHTHSPKAGQGMNVSMQDAFNLGWKLAAVLRGLAAPELLRTYSDERRAVAHELIDFDRKLAAMFSAPPRTPRTPAATASIPRNYSAISRSSSASLRGSRPATAPRSSVAFQPGSTWPRACRSGSDFIRLPSSASPTRALSKSAMSHGPTEDGASMSSHPSRNRPRPHPACMISVPSLPPLRARQSAASPRRTPISMRLSICARFSSNTTAIST